jgi:hypothetical protein
MTEPGAEESKAAPLSAVVIRSIRPEDAAGLQAFHGRLSDDTIRNRFLGPHPVLRDAEAHRFTALARGEGAALVAIVDEVIVAAGRYVHLSGGDAAEVAFVVEDPYQCGLAYSCWLCSPSSHSRQTRRTVVGPTPTCWATVIEVESGTG